MNSIMGMYINDFMIVYLDDILVFSITEYAHENHLRLVLQDEGNISFKPNLKSVSLVNHV